MAVQLQASPSRTHSLIARSFARFSLIFRAHLTRIFRVRPYRARDREFNVAEDMYAQDSIELLRHSGIDFAAHAARGIDTKRFGEVLLVSGVVLSPDVRWITFHSG
jgi:hypothetical protein